MDNVCRFEGDLLLTVKMDLEHDLSLSHFEQQDTPVTATRREHLNTAAMRAVLLNQSPGETRGQVLDDTSRHLLGLGALLGDGALVCPQCPDLDRLRERDLDLTICSAIIPQLLVDAGEVIFTSRDGQ